MAKKLKNFIEDATKNIESDRAFASKLLYEVINAMSAEAGNTGQVARSHRDLGELAAKYLETLQRSNEQLVKIAGILQKEEGGSKSTELSASEKDEIFEKIKDSKG